MKKFMPLYIIFGFIALTLQAQSPKLKFNNKGEFKIAQFTDLHISYSSKGTDTTFATIKAVLETEKPDLVILTGDIITDQPAKEGWLAIAKVFADMRTPWAVTLGNHDDETGISRKAIFELIANLPYFIGEKGPDITGCGNHALPVYDAKDQKPAAVLYCMDTHNSNV